MLHLNVRAAFVAATLSTLAACGPAVSSHTAATAGAESDADGSPVPGPLYYNFPLSLHKETFKPLPTQPADDKEAGYAFKVDASTLTATWDYNNYQYGGASLDLHTGVLSIHAIHQGMNTAIPPQSGGDVDAYTSILGSLQRALRDAEAPADVQNYLTQIQNFLASKQYNSLKLLLNHDSDKPVANAEHTFQVQYTAVEPRDLVIRMTGNNEKFDRLYLGTYRTTVQAGAGTATITVKYPANPRGICFDTQSLPVGTEVPAVVALNTYNTCL